MNNRIQFFSEGIEFKLKEKVKFRDWITDVIRSEDKHAYYTNFIFCNDEYLLELNKIYLKKSTLTDIITFSFTEEENSLSGDIYISIDRVRENALKFNVPFDNELKRVMIHGILHLVGYKDKTTQEKKKMTEAEDKYLLSCLF